MKEAVITLFMTVITFFTSVSGIGSAKVLKDQPKAEDFKPVMRFMICSDTHINSTTDPKRERLSKAIAYAYETAEQDESYPYIDAFSVVGDCTNDGTDEQFQAFGETVKGALKDNTKFLAIVAQNHDGYQGKRCLGKIDEITGVGSDYHLVINGYHFIGISTSNKEGQRYGLYQRTWLREQLKQAAEDDPHKPIFVCHHEHVKYTVYGSSMLEGWGVPHFRDIFNKYPQIVHFSGHSHYPINDPRSIWQGEFTAVGTGAMAYMEVTVDRDRSLHPTYDADYSADLNYDRHAQFWLVDVDKDDQVRLRGFDAINNDLLCEYLITAPADRDSFAYTPYNQKAHTSVPQFDKGAEITVRPEGDGKYVFSAPAPVTPDGRNTFVYRLEIVNEKGRVVDKDYLVNNYWVKDPLDTVIFHAEAKPGWTVRIKAENSYGVQSDPIEAKIG